MTHLRGKGTRQEKNCKSWRCAEGSVRDRSSDHGQRKLEKSLSVRENLFVGTLSKDTGSFIRARHPEDSANRKAPRSQESSGPHQRRKKCQSSCGGRRSASLAPLRSSQAGVTVRCAEHGACKRTRGYAICPGCRNASVCGAPASLRILWQLPSVGQRAHYRNEGYP